MHLSEDHAHRVSQAVLQCVGRALKSHCLSAGQNFNNNNGGGGGGIFNNNNAGGGGTNFNNNNAGGDGGSNFNNNNAGGWGGNFNNNNAGGGGTNFNNNNAGGGGTNFNNNNGASSRSLLDMHSPDSRCPTQVPMYSAPVLPVESLRAPNGCTTEGSCA